MANQCGITHEAMKYAKNWDLPVHWIVGDNGLSVMTDTYKTWNIKHSIHHDFYTTHNYTYFRYKNMYPHSGLKQRIAF
jgi:hypothetical protein